MHGISLGNTLEGFFPIRCDCIFGSYGEELAAYTTALLALGEYSKQQNQNDIFSYNILRYSVDFKICFAVLCPDSIAPWTVATFGNVANASPEK